MAFVIIFITSNQSLYPPPPFMHWSPHLICGRDVYSLHPHITYILACALLTRNKMSYNWEVFRRTFYLSSWITGFPFLPLPCFLFCCSSLFLWQYKCRRYVCRNKVAKRIFWFPVSWALTVSLTLRRWLIFVWGCTFCLKITWKIIMLKSKL